MHVAQPSLSQQIRLLEAELGGPLLERLPRELRLTAAGEAFLPEARAAVHAAARAGRAARRALGASEVELEIATVRSLAVGLLPQVIQRMHQLHPGIVVRLHEFGHRAHLEESLRAGVGDVALGPRPTRWSGPVRKLGWEQFVVVLPPVARGGRRAISLEELADDEWVLFQDDHGLAAVVLRLAENAGFEPKCAVRTSQVEAAARLAAAGLGVALIPRNAVPPGLEASVLSLSPPVIREVTLYSRGLWSPAAKALMAALDAESWERPPRGATVVA